MENVILKTVIGNDDRIPVNELMSIDPEKYKKSLAVASINFPNGGAGTAWRVSDRNLMITNFHVVEGQDISAAKIHFYYSEGEGISDVKVTVKGKCLVISNSSLDYALFEIESVDFKADVLNKFWHLDIDPNGAKLGEKIYIPQFPCNYKNHPGCPKVVSLHKIINGNRFEPTIEGFKNHGGDVYYSADTGGGASGSPIISADTHKVIAINNSHSGDKNWGINMKSIWEEIKEFIE